jgi:molybdopterin molybdotransferase
VLLSYEDALTRILSSVRALTVGAEASVSHIKVSAEDIFATTANPRFDNSSVDGYALHAEDLSRVGETLEIAMTVAAGDDPPSPMARGMSARIFTGARLPLGTAAVVMQENVEADGKSVVLREPLTSGQGLRRAGSDFESGQKLVSKGAPLTAGVAGLLASQGILRPKINPVPRCLVITTGDEIVSPEQVPALSQVRDVIGTMLSSSIAAVGVCTTAFAADDAGKLASIISDATTNQDAIVIAGGASVGDRDYVAQVVAGLGKLEFHGVNIRPGKPLLFGFVNGVPLLGLPGNPASAYVCFHLFGLPLLKQLGGWAEPNSLWFEAEFGANHDQEPRDVFARVTFAKGVATPIFEQASFGLRSLGSAQGLACLPGGKVIRKGDRVNVTIL